MRGPGFLLALLTASIGRAVIVGGSDGTQNMTDPGGGLPWGHVGSVNGTSGVYLGSFGGGFWVATATHVGAGNFTLGSTTYTLAAGSAVQIDGSDLTLFRITSNPGLSNLTISSSAPAPGASVVLIGNGANRASNLIPTTWHIDTDTNPDTWSLSPDPPNTDTTASGYFWAAGQTKRWGDNTITGSDTYNIGTGATTALYTTFSVTTSQGATGDSGGGAFYFNGSSWELLGIMGAIATFSDQPSSTAVFDNRTYLASMPAYYSSVTSAIPEPADVALWGGAVAAVMALAWRRRRR